MNSATTKQFWKCFDALPVNVQRLAADAFGRWQADPGHLRNRADGLSYGTNQRWAPNYRSDFPFQRVSTPNERGKAIQGACHRGIHSGVTPSIRSMNRPNR